MPRLRIAIALNTLLLAALASGQTDPALWRFLPANPKALVSIDWKHIRQSHVGAILREKWLDVNGAAIPGIEFLNDVDRFVISSPGRDPGNDAPQAPMLILARGHFDTAKVRHLLVSHGAKPQMFNSIQVYRPQGKNSKDMAFVVLDAQTILIGDARSVFAGLEQNKLQADAPVASALSARAIEMDAKYEVWALMTGPEALASDRLMGLFTGGELGSETRGFEAGVSLRNGLDAEINLSFQNETAAKSMASELSKLLKAAIKEKISEPAMLDLEKKLKVTSEGAVAKISLRLNHQELEKNARIFAASRSQAPAAVAGLRPAITLEPEPIKPEKSVIKIEGLDEGPREIPYKPDRP